MAFPTSPTNGQTYTTGGVVYVYSTTTTSWQVQTYNNIDAAAALTQIKTVDGAGSGLDADLLDGQSSAYFLPASSYTAADVLTKIKTVDGSGSGLDADLLDGISSASFVRSDTTDIINTSSTYPLTLQNSTNAGGIGIAFSDASSGGYDQYGYINFNHSDGSTPSSRHGMSMNLSTNQTNGLAVIVPSGSNFYVGTNYMISSGMPGLSPNRPAASPSSILAADPYAPSGFYWVDWGANDRRPVYAYIDFGTTTSGSRSTTPGWLKIDREFISYNYERMLDESWILSTSMTYASNGRWNNSGAVDSQLKTVKFQFPFTFTGFNVTNLVMTQTGDPDGETINDSVATVPTNAQIVSAGNGTTVDLGTNIASLGVYAGNSSGVGVRPRLAGVAATGTVNYDYTYFNQTESGLSADRIIWFYSDGGTELFHLNDYEYWLKF